MGNQNTGHSDRDVINRSLNNHQHRVDVLATQVGTFVASGIPGEAQGVGNIVALVAKFVGRGFGMISYLFFAGPIRYLFLSLLLLVAVYFPLTYIANSIFNRPLPLVYDPFYLNTGLSGFYSSVENEGLAMGLKIFFSPISYIFSFFSSLNEIQYQPISVAVLILSTFPVFLALEFLSINFFLFFIGGINLTVVLHHIFLGHTKPFAYGDFWIGSGSFLFSLIFFILCGLTYFFQPLFLRRMKGMAFNVLGEPQTESFGNMVVGNNVLKSPIRIK